MKLMPYNTIPDIFMSVGWSTKRPPTNSTIAACSEPSLMSTSADAVVMTYSAVGRYDNIISIVR